MTTTQGSGRYIEAPTWYSALPLDGPRVFLAGGITGCPDWQAPVARRLTAAGAVVFNPRRARWVDPARSSMAAVEQVDWETDHLWHPALDLVLLWFPACDPATTTQPISMFELGALVKGGQPIVLGADVNYPRVLDVVLLMRRYRPGLHVHTNLGALTDAATGQLGLTAGQAQRTTCA